MAEVARIDHLAAPLWHITVLPHLYVFTSGDWLAAELVTKIESVVVVAALVSQYEEVWVRCER